ncbi:MAG TPA: efflux RND transporter periplasmic adaptor subunit [Blastocatellia bacterium]|nr:efflux RND transporter periplasmic adaptor subunit [Blastocatellia bacterium]
MFSTACKSGYPTASTRNGPSDNAGPREVHTLLVSEVPMEQTVSVTGTLAAQEEATVSAKVPGRVRSITVDLGSVVRRGQVVVELEPRDAQLRLQQAEAALAQARARVGLSPDGADEKVNLEQTGTVAQARAILEEARSKRDRAAKLFEQGVISRAELDTVEAGLKVAESRYQDAVEEVRNRQALVLQRKSEVELARQQIADMTIRAPFDGVVQQKIANLGEYIAAGAGVVAIVRMDPLRLRAEVPEREAHSVRSGQEVRVAVEGDTNLYTGRIARLSPTITAQNRLLIVEAEVRNNGQLRPGSFARADIVTSGRSLTVAVPTKAIVSFAGVEKVLVIQDGKALEKPITTRRRTTDWTEVVSGINVGEMVIIDPGNLQSGQPVRVVAE